MFTGEFCAATKCIADPIQLADKVVMCFGCCQTALGVISCYFNRMSPNDFLPPFEQTGRGTFVPGTSAVLQKRWACSAIGHTNWASSKATTCLSTSVYRLHEWLIFGLCGAAGRRRDIWRCWILTTVATVPSAFCPRYATRCC